MDMPLGVLTHGTVFWGVRKLIMCRKYLVHSSSQLSTFKLMWRQPAKHGTVLDIRSISKCSCPQFKGKVTFWNKTQMVF